MSHKLAFLFPGQGSQYVGMAKALAEHSVGRETLAEADEILGMPLSQLISDGPASELDQTANTQPAIFTVSVGWLRVLKQEGISPAACAGHSLGEYAAAVACGAVSFADALPLVRLRGELMTKAADGTGTMAAVLGLTGPEVEGICADVGGNDVVAANFNAPGQVVISGLNKAVEQAAELAKSAGARRVIPLAVSGPFHSPMMEPVGTQLQQALRSIEVGDPTVELVVNYTGRPVEHADQLVDALVAGVSSSVRWEQAMNYLIQTGIAHFVEVGPGKVLTGLLKKIDRKAVCLSVDDPAGWEKLLAMRKGDVVI